MDYFPQRLKPVHKRLLHFSCFFIAVIGLPIFYFCVGGVVKFFPNCVEFGQSSLFKMKSESHGGFKHFAASIVKQHSQHLTFGRSQNSTVNQWNEFGFFGLNTRSAVTPTGKPMIQNNSEQSSQNATQYPRRKDSLPSRFYFFTHLLSATIGGFVGSFIMWLWIKPRWFCKSNDQ
jgi:hypothetical protein